MAANIDYSALRAQTMGAGNDEEAVTVNTRALIDKVLARYSGEWTVLRELLQNAADASASNVTIKFETVPSSTVPLPQNADSSALLKHTLLYHTIKRLLVTNNGQPFGPNDWSRLKRIAEGNPDETKIGAFGVGFYSVFADCEEPFVSSGNEAMAFYWKGNSLFTRRLQLPETQSTTDTTFVLDSRNTTSPIPSLLPLCQFLASSLTFVGLTSIDLWLDDWRLIHLNKFTAPSVDVKIPKNLETRTTEGLMQVITVMRETAQLDAKWLNIVAWKRNAGANTGLVSASASVVKGAPSSQSLRSFFSRLTAGSNSAAADKAAKEDRASQEAISEDLTGESVATVFLHVNTANVRTSANKAFSQELERATKKPPPKTTTIAILTSSYDEKAASTSTVSGAAWKATDIFSSVLPSKYGRIFIGFPTHQTTGLNAHISAPSVIPTVERESIDLNARWVRTWNMEMLRAAGIVCRVAWSGEIDSVKERLTQSITIAKKSKVGKEEIAAILPEAIHILNQFTFRESTPSSQVGSLVEEAFWTCNRKASIDILSSCGVLPSQEVRIAVDDLSFVEGIPVLPKALVEQANEFVKRLRDYGIITEITISDIKKELEAKALNGKQLVEFLEWIGHKARINEVDEYMVRTLLDVTVANDYEDAPDQGKVIVLSEIKHFVNKNKISASVPVPPNTMPFKFTKNLDREVLGALGWDDLQVVPWLRWLVENAGGRGQLSKEYDLTASPSFASIVLPIISKQWDGLSQSSKATVVELMSCRTVIPTKVGMKRPEQAYFPSVKLFDDLPAVTGLHSVKEKFLAALGVRKTVELGIVFERLMAPPEYTSDPSAPQGRWSHIDLIKYLTSIRGDIPMDDVKRLRSTPICPAEAGSPNKGTIDRYIISELFEPTDTHRVLGLQVIQWPGGYQRNSDEGRFMTFLGLKSYPSAPEVIAITAKAATAGNHLLRDRALRYFVDFYHNNKYAGTSIASITTPFLPLQGNDAQKVALPSDCVTNERAAIIGFDILRNDLHPHAEKFDVQRDPPIAWCIDRLLANPPQSTRSAKDVFGYLSTRLSAIGDTYSQRLGNASIVPIASKARNSLTGNVQTVRHVPPRLCFLGDGDKYADIFDYADFGSEANSFLLRCGSKHEPTTSELAQIVVREPARIFSVFQSPERYLDLLRTLADAWPILKKDKALAKEMKRVPFLLGFKELSSAPGRVEQNQSQPIDVAEGYDVEDDIGVKTYQLAKAHQIVIADDMISYNLFKDNLLTAPFENSLEDFYFSLGAPTLGSVVEEKHHIGDVTEDQAGALKLKKLIEERARLFLHDIPHDQIKHEAKWLEKNLTVVSVRSVALRKSLKGTTLSHNARITAATLYDARRGQTLYFTSAKYETFQVSQAVVTLLLLRPKPQQAMLLDMLLNTGLQGLRTRGYNVERILRQKANEVRIAEEERKKQLDEEQKNLKEQERAFKELQARHPVRVQEQVSMPGVFPDSPDRNPAAQSLQISQANGDEPQRRPRGLFSEFTRRLGFEDGRRSSSETNMPSMGTNSQGSNEPPPPYSQDDGQKSLTTIKPPKPVTAPHQTQQNLVSAIQASRPYHSRSVVAQPSVNEVKETQSYCDSRPAQNITFCADSSSGVKIFLSNDLADKDRFMAQNSSAFNAFAAILLDCADAFSLPRTSVHIYYEGDSSTIAFNYNKALFCNYLYFENLHLPAVQQGRKADALVYWWVVLCHELAHNLVQDHSSAHSYYV